MLISPAQAPKRPPAWVCFAAAGTRDFYLPQGMCSATCFTPLPPPHCPRGPLVSSTLSPRHPCAHRLACFPSSRYVHQFSLGRTGRGSPSHPSAAPRPRPPWLPSAELASPGWHHRGGITEATLRVGHSVSLQQGLCSTALCSRVGAAQPDPGVFPPASPQASSWATGHPLLRAWGWNDPQDGSCTSVRRRF